MRPLSTFPLIFPLIFAVFLKNSSFFADFDKNRFFCKKQPFLLELCYNKKITLRKGLGTMQLLGAIFDMDGTLVDSMFAWRALLPRLVQQEMGRSPTEQELKRLQSMTAQEGAEFCKEITGLDWSVTEIFRWFSGEMSVFYRTKARPKPGALDFVRRLRDAGIPMYVATATDRDLVEIALEATGFAGCFQGILTSPEVGVSKSHSAEIYRRSMAAIGSDKAHTIVFEDSLHAISTAAADGFTVVSIYDETSRRDRETIRSLSLFHVETFDALALDGQRQLILT